MTNQVNSEILELSRKILEAILDKVGKLKSMPYAHLVDLIHSCDEQANHEDFSVRVSCEIIKTSCNYEIERRK